MSDLAIQTDDPALRDWLEGFELHDIEAFTARVFPPSWGGVRARILETGATLTSTPGPWAPRWTPIFETVRVGRTDDETRMRSIFYRTHDCVHQLWGLTNPRDLQSEEDFRDYKRAQMCGEVVVLLLTEFVFGTWAYQAFPDLRDWIDGRCAVPMWRGPLAGRSLSQLAMRLDELLHKGWVAKWARDDPGAAAWHAYFAPMLEHDRAVIDAAWAAMQAEPERVVEIVRHAPKARFRDAMNGLELTLWMVADFEHLLWSSPEVDEGLRRFNRERRAQIVLPTGWPSG